MFTARRDDGSARAVLDDLDDIPDMPAFHALNGRDTTPMAITAAHAADMDEPGDGRGAARGKAIAAGSAIAGTLGKLGQGTASSMRERQAAVSASNTEADAMTVFGARGQPRIGGKPRYLGLMLSLLLLLALAVLALWSTYFLSDATPGLFGTVEEAEVATLESEPPIIVAPVVESGTSETSSAEPVQPASPDQTVVPTTPDQSNSASNAIEAAVESALSEAPIPETVLPTQDPDTPVTNPEVIDPNTLAETELALLQDPATEVISNPPPDQIPQPPPTRAEAKTRYAATGIWQLDPELSETPSGGDRLDDIYLASIDPDIVSHDAVALPGAATLTNDLRPSSLTPPPALGTAFDLDDRGLVRATPGGALSPDGIRIIAGTPPVVPGVRPGSTAPAAEESPAAKVDAEQERLRGIRPRIRPETLQETNERSRFGGRSSSELAALRPVLRPASEQEERAAEVALAEPDTQTAGTEVEPTSEDATRSATEFAVLASLTPSTRPSGFAATVQRALEEAQENTPEPENNATPAVAAARVPTIPTRASVAKQATERNAIKLSRVNLIGVYGSPSARRALVRLKSGRYVKVEVGDRVDGGRVAAIGENELRYVKGGRNITLTIPSG